MTPEKASFDNLAGLMKFTFVREKNETLTEAMQCVQSSDCNKSVIMEYGDIIFQMDKDYYHLKLHQTIDELYQRPDDYQIDSKYTNVLNICLTSKLTFQYFYTHTALLMIKHQYPIIVQNFVDQFIFDVRLRQASIDDFCKMYEDDLYFYVKIVTDGCFSPEYKQREDDLNYVGESLLHNLRFKDQRRFVVIATHFEAFRHLLSPIK